LKYIFLLILIIIKNHCLTGTTGENIKSLKQSSYWWLPEFIPSSPKDKVNIIIAIIIVIITFIVFIIVINK
jgi:hypothetical protein